MENIFLFLNDFFEIFWHPVTHGGRYAAIVLAGIFSAVIFMIIYKRFSNQEGIDREKRKITGHILEIRIYQDNLGLIFNRIFGIIKHNLLYIRYTIPPLAIIMIPLIIITMQVNNRCGYQPLAPGSEFIIEGVLQAPPGSEGQAMDPVKLQTSEGVSLRTPVLRVQDKPAVFGRAQVSEDTGGKEQWVELSEGGRAVRKMLFIAPGGQPSFDPVTVRYQFSQAMIHNAGGFLPPDSPFSEIALEYDRENYSFLGINMDAIVLYFVITMIFALLLKPVFKVRF